MAFSLTSVSPSTISCEGGKLLTITGTFVTTHRYCVYVGETETTADPVCYSGVVGQGSVIYPTNATTLKVYLPYLVDAVASGNLYSVLVVDIDTLETHLLSEVIAAAPKQFYSLVYAYRKVMHEDFKVGPRGIALEEEVSESGGGR